MIKETIIVEGRDDEIKIKSCLDANIIVTHGYGIRQSIWKEIYTANKRNGIIIFTDPDFAGKQIRKKIKMAFPDAKEAFIKKKDATRGQNIGVENASCKDILEALNHIRKERQQINTYRIDDLVKYNLIGEGSRNKREYISHKLGIGYSNAKTFLKKLNAYGIERSELEKVLEELK